MSDTEDNRVAEVDAATFKQPHLTAAYNTTAYNTAASITAASDTTAVQLLKTDPHLGKHIILLGLAGSYAYGTNQENSDIDVRGVTLNRKSDLIGMTSL